MSTYVKLKDGVDEVAMRGPVGRIAKEVKLAPGNFLSRGLQSLFDDFRVCEEVRVGRADRYHNESFAEALVGIQWVKTITPVLKSAQAIFKYRVADLEAQRDGTLFAPVSLDIGGLLYPVSMSDRSQFRMSAANGRAVGNPNHARKWVMQNGLIVDMTNAQIKAMYSAAEAHVDAVFDNAIAHAEALGALLAADNAQGLVDYDLTTGWPPVYVEA